MQHERGDVPGPSTTENPRAPKGEPASEPTAVPQAPVGWETGSSSPDPTKSPDPIPGKFPVPSKGETKADTANASGYSGGPYVLFAGEDS